MTGKEIKEKREALGLSQKDLAALIGVGKNTIYNYESGGTIPKGKIPILEKVLNPNNGYENNKEKEKASSEETRLEDIIAKRVLEEVGPFIGEMTDRVMAALLELTMSLDRIRSEQEEISQHQETFNKIQKDLKEVQEKTYALIENKQ